MDSQGRHVLPRPPQSPPQREGAGSSSQMPTSHRDTPDETRAEAPAAMSHVTTKMKASYEEMIVNAHTKFNAIPYRKRLRLRAEKREESAVAVELTHVATERRFVSRFATGDLPPLNAIELERGQADNMTSRDAADTECAIITEALDERY